MVLGQERLQPRRLSLHRENQMAILYSYADVWLLVNSQNGLKAKTPFSIATKDPHIEWS